LLSGPNTENPWKGGGAPGRAIWQVISKDKIGAILLLINKQYTPPTCLHGIRAGLESHGAAPGGCRHGGFGSRINDLGVAG